MQEPPLVFDELVSYELARTTTAFRNSLQRQMANIHLHSGQISVLRELWLQDGLRQVDIAERLKLAAPTVNKMLTGLIKINLVVRERLEDDARSTRIFLTRKGAEIRDDVETQWKELETTCRSAISDAERYLLIDLLARIRNKLTGTDPEVEE